MGVYGGVEAGVLDGQRRHFAVGCAINSSCANFIEDGFDLDGIRGLRYKWKLCLKKSLKRLCPPLQISDFNNVVKIFVKALLRVAPDDAVGEHATFRRRYSSRLEEKLGCSVQGLGKSCRLPDWGKELWRRAVGPRKRYRKVLKVVSSLVAWIGAYYNEFPGDFVGGQLIVRVDEEFTRVGGVDAEYS